MGENRAEKAVKSETRDNAQGDPLTYLHSMRAAIASVASDQQISNSTFNGTFTLNGAIERDAQISYR